MVPAAAPVEAEEAERLFAPLAGARGLVAAVSGGPDSLALLVLLAEWAKARGRPPLFAVTVDHGLRPEAAAEADLVADVAAHWKVDHRTLVWSGAKPTSGLGEAARDARYRLLATAVRSSRSTHLVTAHHLDDQAETVLLRLSAGSGIDGLAAMRQISPFGEGLLLARPFLGLPKARLIATCAERGLLPASDPTNHDLARPRPRLRRAAASLAREGLTPERLGQLARRAARAADALAFQSAAALDAAGLMAGPMRADLPLWKALSSQPEEIRLRCLVSAFERALPKEAWPRLGRVEALLARLDAALGGGQALRATLAGLRIELSAAGALRLLAESPRRSRSGDA